MSAPIPGPKFAAGPKRKPNPVMFDSVVLQFPASACCRQIDAEQSTEDIERRRSQIRDTQARMNTLLGSILVSALFYVGVVIWVTR